jgi:transcriptional regulator with XRE-family HTH domain
MPRRKISEPTRLRLGGRLRTLREQRGLSMDQLADETQQSKGHISNIERGLVNITVGTLLRMAKALGTTPIYILCAAGDSALERRAEELHALPLEAQREVAAKLAQHGRSATRPGGA